MNKSFSIQVYPFVAAAEIHQISKYLTFNLLLVLKGSKMPLKLLLQDLWWASTTLTLLYNFLHPLQTFCPFLCQLWGYYIYEDFIKWHLPARASLHIQNCPLGANITQLNKEEHHYRYHFGEKYKIHICELKMNYPALEYNQQSWGICVS